ncbi:MAG: HAAS signaling domain-containing protein [Phycisphaerales bacterium JB038]
MSSPASATPATLSRWRLLRTTPLRDVVRLRLTGRLDVAHRIARADLPAALAEVVQEILRRARLSRFERADLAEELIAHFQDGLESGASPEALLHRFGDPRQAARLLRRARKRNRTLRQQIIMRTLQFLFLLLGLIVLGYLLLALRYFSGSTTISTDYLKKYQERAQAAPEAARAWPDYRAAYLAIDKGEHRFTRWLRPGDEGWDETVALLKIHAGTIEQVRQAARKPALGYVPGYTLSPEDALVTGRSAAEVETSDAPGDYRDYSMIEVLLPHFGPLRLLAKSVTADMRLAALEGDSARAFEDALAGLALGRHAQETPFLIADLVAFAIWSLTCNDLGALLSEQPDLFTDAQLVELAHSLAAVGDNGQPRLHLEGEKDMFHDMLQRLYTDDGAGNGRLTAEGVEMLESIVGIYEWDDPLAAVGGPVLAVLVADRKEMARKHAEIFALAEAELHLPYYQRLQCSAMDQRLEEINDSPTLRLRYILIATLMPAIGKAAFYTDMIAQKRDGLLIGIALERYRRERGAYPPTLAALVPAYLPSVPLDRCSGAPVRYRLESGRPLVYGVGPDGDDDGGRLPQRLLGTDQGVWQTTSRDLRDPAPNDGDWILYPQPKRDPILDEEEDY